MFQVRDPRFESSSTCLSASKQTEEFQRFIVAFYSSRRCTLAILALTLVSFKIKLGCLFSPRRKMTQFGPRSDGSSYEGNMEQGKMHGQGRFVPWISLAAIWDGNVMCQEKRKPMVNPKRGEPI